MLFPHQCCTFFFSQVLKLVLVFFSWCFFLCVFQLGFRYYFETRFLIECWVVLFLCFCRCFCLGVFPQIFKLGVLFCFLGFYFGCFFIYAVVFYVFLLVFFGWFFFSYIKNTTSSPRSLYRTLIGSAAYESKISTKCATKWVGKIKLYI